jgi:two-component system, cell cycle sensor histidine kinase and response regulator CckA
MLHPTHNPALVVLSIVVACMASYAALQLAGRIVAARRVRILWLLGSAFTMGIGIWSMHFVAMLAFRVDLPVAYAVDLVVVSALVAFAASLLAFMIVSRPAPHMATLAVASLFMGPAIAGMHYIGMAAMRMPAAIEYNSRLVTLSVVIAVSASLAALRLFVEFRDDRVPRPAWLKPASAVLMGAAISGMHYTGMMAAHFVPRPGGVGAGQGLIATDALGYSVGLVATSIASIALAAVLLDRSVRAKAAETAAIRRSEERVRLLLEGAREYALFSLDLDGKVAQWNAGAERLMGYTTAEIVGQPMAVFLAAEGVPGADAERQIDEARDKGRFEGEHWWTRKDGALFLAHIVISALDDAAGKRVEFSVLVRDVTEQHRAAEALRRSQERLRLALAAARMTTWELDLDSGLLVLTDDVGSTGRRILKVEELLARVHPDDRARVEEALKLGASEGRFDVDFRKITPTGEVRWINSRGERPGSDSALRPRLVGLSIDITDRRHLEEQFRQSQKMEAIGQLAGGIAHDFNNLLTVIAGNAQLLLESMGDTDVPRSAAQEVLEASDRAAALTRQLLAFSRGQLLQPKPLDLNGIVSEMQPMLRRMIGEDVLVETRFDVRQVVAMADRGQLEQILLNLAVNARDAMPAGGTLQIETSAEVRGLPPGASDGPIAPESFVMLRVSDSGVGIDPAIQSRVFEPFFSTKEPSRGTGLGLSTVYGIVKQSGGHIFVESEPGKGSTFTIYLRRAVLPAAEAEAKPVAASAHVKPGSETVLLVEDEDGVRKLARRILERQGYEVLEAACGADALDLAERHREPIHLLLTDVVMPAMGGRQLSERLVERRPGTRVLFMSGYTDDQLAPQDRAGAEVAFLPKPFDSKGLTAAVRAVLDA